MLILHNVLSNATWMYFLGVGVWGGYRAFQGQGVDGGYFGAIAIGEFLFLAQGILGGLLYFAGGRTQDNGLHILYGLFNLILLPFVYGYTRGDDSNRAQWIYMFSSLFLFGTALRSIQTGV